MLRSRTRGCERRLYELAELALIEQNADDETATLHDLLRDYTREQLGEELAATHTALLSTYNPDGIPWPEIEHDGYLYYHLAYHLQAAGCKEELHELLTGSPDWMEAKFVACTGDVAYVADLDLAIGDFSDPVSDPDLVQMLVKLYAARQVVNARVSKYRDTDLQTLVWLGRGDEAAAHARLREKPNHRFESLLTVYKTLKEKGQYNPSLLYEAQQLADNIEDDWLKVGRLSHLAAALAQAGDEHRANEVFDEAQQLAGNIRAWRRALALSDLAAALAQAGDERRANAVFEEAYQFADSMRDNKGRSLTLTRLAAILAQAERFSRAFAVYGLRDLDNFLQGLSQWAPIFEKLAPGLSVSVLRDAIGIAGWMRSDWREIHELLTRPHPNDKRGLSGEVP